MEKWFTKTIAVCVICLFYMNLKAQNKDYIITNTGDTIKCNTIKTVVFGGYKYKTTNNGEFVKIKEQNVKEVYMADKDILTSSVFVGHNPKPIFMTVIEKGKICLFEIQMSSGSYGGTISSNTEWFVSKGTDTVTLLKYSGTANLMGFKGRKNRKNDFAEMLNDNKDVYDKYIAEDRFTFTQLRSLIHIYNTGEPLKD
jgi:hypothetical protein